MQPFDYRIAVQDPLQMALAGYQQGQQFQQQRVQGERETQLYNMEMQQYQANQAKLQEEQARAKQVQANLADMFERVDTGTLPEGYIGRFLAENPEVGEQTAAYLQGISEEQKMTGVRDQTRLLMMLNNEPGTPSEDSQVAMLLKERKAAAEAAGKPDQAAAAEASLMEYLNSPAALKASLMTNIAIGSPEAWKVIEPLVVKKPVERELVTTEEGVFAADLSAEDVMGGMQRLGTAPAKSPLIGSIGFGDTVKTGQLAPETALVEDPDAPGGLRIIPIAGGTAQDVKATAIASADDVIKTLNDLKTAKGASNRYGLSSVGGLAPAVPGSDEANAQAIINKVKGQAFLTALDSLRGTGTITEIEGAKATQAVTVLSDQNISWPFALAAADELIGIVEAARKRKAGAMGGPPIGTVEDGFVFQGGDPADQNNWKLQ
jgi:hypothetical protein